MENLANTESRVTKNSANTEIRATENSAHTESRVIENSVDIENWVIQESGGGGQETERWKRCFSKQKDSSTVVPKGYYQDTKTQISKDASKRVGREKRRGRAS
jgi:hypothetical protein